MATNDDANALGYITPADDDLIADGNEAISNNARVSTQLVTDAQAAIAAAADSIPMHGKGSPVGEVVGRNGDLYVDDLSSGGLSLWINTYGGLNKDEWAYIAGPAFTEQIVENNTRLNEIQAYISHGAGPPDPAQDANPGALYIDTVGATGARLWQQTSLSSANPTWTVISGDTGEQVRTSWDAAGVVSGEPLPENLSPTPGVAGKVTMRRVDRLAQIGIYGATWTGTVGGWSGFYAASLGRDIIAGCAVDNTFQTLRITQVGTVFRLGTAGLEADAQFGLKFTYPAAITWPA